MISNIPQITIDTIDSQVSLGIFKYLIYEIITAMIKNVIEKLK